MSKLPINSDLVSGESVVRSDNFLRVRLRKRHNFLRVRLRERHGPGVIRKQCDKIPMRRCLVCGGTNLSRFIAPCGWLQDTSCQDLTYPSVTASSWRKMTSGLRVTVGMTQPRAILPGMKIRDYAHLGAKARLEQLQEEIAQIHRDFPALKHTTAQTAPNRSAWTPKQRTGVSKRMKAVRKARKKAQR